MADRMDRFYIDTEFTRGGVLMSLALVRNRQDSLYLVNPDLFGGRDGGSLIDMGTWVEQNVYPHLLSVPPDVEIRQDPYEAWGDIISRYIYREDNLPQIIADWPVDLQYLMELLIVGPGEAVPMQHQTHFTIIRHIDVYPTEVEGAIEHNAWWDALAIKNCIELLEKKA